MEGVEEFWRPEERVKFDKVIKLSAKENMNAGEVCAEIRDIIDRLDDQKRGNKSPGDKTSGDEEDEIDLDEGGEREDSDRAFGHKKSLKHLLL